jgi:hypothetical protein
VKRSAQVALLLMGATSIGATSYALTPRNDCSGQPTPGSAVVGTPSADTTCSSGRSSSGGGHGSSRWSSSSSNGSGTSGPTGGSTSTSAARGGFGSTGTSVAAHSSGG